MPGMKRRLKIKVCQPLKHIRLPCPATFHCLAFRSTDLQVATTFLLVLSEIIVCQCLLAQIYRHISRTADVLMIGNHYRVSATTLKAGKDGGMKEGYGQAIISCQSWRYSSLNMCTSMPSNLPFTTSSAPCTSMQASHRALTLPSIGSMHAQNCQASLSCGMPFAQSKFCRFGAIDSLD